MDDSDKLDLLITAIARVERNLSIVLNTVVDVPPMEARSLPSASAAQYLGCHSKTLSKLRRAGRLKGYQDGDRGHWRYRVTDLDDYRRGLAPTDNTRTPRDREIDWGA